jgi:hypothetical protein
MKARRQIGARHIARMRGVFARPLPRAVASGADVRNPAANSELLGTTGRKTPARYAISQFR